jgi:UDP-N-acetylglucosamine 4,6-dehydratase
MFLSNKRILVTGGTGSLGRAVLKRANEEKWNSEFVIFSRDETRQGQLKSQYPQYEYFLGDIADYRDVYRAMRRRIDVVFHFAAYKQVPSAQNNVPATINTNIVGSQNVVDAALEAGVRHVVAASTDKACEPVNLYGISKAAMEALFQHANRYNETAFHLARYGNVVCSNASVIPLFERQAAAGGPLTITHPDMTRFWITLDDAINLVLEAYNQPPGVIVVPKASGMSLMDTAAAVGPDLERKIIGIRAGEKIHESLVSGAESFFAKEDSSHFFVYPFGSPVMRQTPFTYTSDTAHQLTADELRAMVALHHQKYD